MRSLEIFNLKDKLEYLDEVARLEYDEWADNKKINKEKRIDKKKKKICTMFTEKDFCKIILVDNDNLIGSISIFSKDCEEEKKLTPWYSTMYVKKEYRHHGYSRVLNKAILKEAKNRKISVLYLKTNLENYYEKFGAIFIKNLKSGEHLYKFEI